MSRNWTPQQKNAIYATDGSVLVSAAAGSGKTAVLVERVIQLITREKNPLDVDRLLIVTFTRAAAAEMRERIQAAVNKLLENDPYNAHLLAQRQLLYSANISTIDSFCGDIVREYFHTLDVARDFRIADEGELEILRQEALDSTFESFYDTEDNDFYSLLDAFKGKQGDQKLRETVLKISEFLTTQPFPDKWLDDMLKNYSETEIAKTVWGKIIIDYAQSAVLHAINLTENSILRLKDDGKLQDAVGPLLVNDLAYFSIVQKRFASSSWNEIRKAVFSFEAGRMKCPKGYKDNPIKISISSNRDEVKDTVKKLQSLFAWSEDGAREELPQLHRLISTLFTLVREYDKRLSELKAKKNILSFADIESLTVKLLATPDDENGYTKTVQAQEISHRFDAVMVDEFQDVNDVQDLIFKSVSKDESNLFVVGDVKQSIYGFRQAKPEIFIERKNEYKRFNEENPEYPATIILDRNFRSRLEVCDAVNFIFERIMTKESAKMEYNADERLVNGAEFPNSDDCNFEISLLETENSDLEKVEIEAKYIADKIHKMINSGFKVKDGDIMRTARYGDFAIILRSPSGKATTYVNTLNNSGIPAYSENKSSFFDAVEIKVMLNLLRVIDNPGIDIPLLSVLCSPMYAFTPDDLAEMRCESRKSSLYSSVCEYAKTNDKARKFVDELKILRDCACTNSVDALISKACEMTGFMSISLAVSGNDSALKNLELLREYARSFESGGYKTLSDFISYTDKLIANKTNLDASSQNEGDTTNAVRVLSIHASKGLEFPVCFIADITHQFNKTDLRNDILLDSKAGLGIKVQSNGVVYNTFPRLATGLKIEENLIAEEMRVLYVALTRAKEKLICVGAVKKCSDYIEKLYSKLVFESVIEPYTVTSCQSYCDWICLCALVHPSLNSVRNDIMSGAKVIPHNGESDWKLQIIHQEQTSDKENVFEDDITSADMLQVVSVGDDSFDYAELLKQNLNFKYKNEDILSLPQKVSASDIAHSQNGDYFEKILSKPLFIAEQNSAPVARGTAHHKFLQYCNFEQARASLDTEIDRLLNDGKLTQEQVDMIDRKTLTEFLSTKLIDRIIASQLVMREKRFTARLKPSEVFDEYKGVKTDATVIIQGAVDLAFVEGGKLVIVDYKTDRVKDITKLAGLYKKQLDLYKSAMEQSEELTVKECILCSIHLGSYITL